MIILQFTPVDPFGIISARLWDPRAQIPDIPPKESQENAPTYGKWKKDGPVARTRIRNVMVNRATAAMFATFNCVGWRVPLLRRVDWAGLPVYNGLDNALCLAIRRMNYWHAFLKNGANGIHWHSGSGKAAAAKWGARFQEEAGMMLRVKAFRGGLCPDCGGVHAVGDGHCDQGFTQPECINDKAWDIGHTLQHQRFCLQSEIEKGEIKTRTLSALQAARTGGLVRGDEERKAELAGQNAEKSS